MLRVPAPGKIKHIASLASVFIGGLKTISRPAKATEAKSANISRAEVSHAVDTVVPIVSFKKFVVVLIMDEDHCKPVMYFDLPSVLMSHPVTTVSAVAVEIIVQLNSESGSDTTYICAVTAPNTARNPRIIKIFFIKSSFLNAIDYGVLPDKSSPYFNDGRLAQFLTGEIR